MCRPGQSPLFEEDTDIKKTDDRINGRTTVSQVLKSSKNWGESV